MSTPPFVPVPPTTRVRRDDFGGIPPPRRLPPRPAEVHQQHVAPGFGVPCPDAGYALLLVHRLEELVHLEPGEHLDDAQCAMATVAIRRAGLLGRAPSLIDVRLAHSLLGYDGAAPPAFARWRAAQLLGITHDLDLRQWLADAATLTAQLPDSPANDEVERWRAAISAAVQEGGHVRP